MFLSSLRKVTKKPLSAAKALPALTKRYLHLHEYQSMQILQDAGIPVPEGYLATTVDEAVAIYNKMIVKDPKKDLVMKAQALTGGRGYGMFKNSRLTGGIQICTNAKQVESYAKQMLGDYLQTKQTGQTEGILVNKIFLVERLYLRKEMYLSVFLDRQTQGPMILACPRGGTSIETLAANSPELLMKQKIDIHDGLTSVQIEEVVKHLDLSPHLQAKGKALLKNLYDLFKKTDATQIEINPLSETNTGDLVLCDAKLNFDDNAEYRQKELFKMRDTSQQDIRETYAQKANLNYVGLHGNIGCLVNGAGLAMATMDMISLHGGSPANFLDMGGSATAQQVEKAFEILNNDQQVESILVNIFGGIMRCDIIAKGILDAAKNLSLQKPIVVRLQGTGLKQAKELFDKSGYHLIVADKLEQAALKAVTAAQIVSLSKKENIAVHFG